MFERIEYTVDRIEQLTKIDKWFLAKLAGMAKLEQDLFCGITDELYRKGGVYKDIVDASARSLNIEKLAQTIASQS